MKKYETPEFELMLFCSTDIITASSVALDDGTQDDFDDILEMK